MMNGPGNPSEVLLHLFPFEGAVYEVILTLFRQNGERRVPNASAIGVRRTGGKLTFTLFEGSNSFQEIEKNHVVGICVPSLPEELGLFVRAALTGHGNDESEFEDEDYDSVNFRTREVPVLRVCPSCIILQIKEVNERFRRDWLGRCRVKQVVGEAGWARTVRREHAAYSRFTGLLFEALIDGSRYLATGNRDCLERAVSHLKTAERVGGREEKQWLRMVREYLYSSSSR